MWMLRRGALVALALGLTATAAASAKELVFGSPFSPLHATNKFAIKPVLDQIATASSGALTFRFQPGGQLFGVRASLASIGSRVADASVLLSVMYPRELKTSLVTTDLFLAEEDPLVASAAATDTIMIGCPECQDEYRKSGVLFLAGYSTTNYKLMCKTPVKTLADVKGRKIKVSSVWGGLVEAMGGVPVSMPMAETVEAMQRGLVDCLMSPPEWLVSYPGTDEAVKYMVDYPFGLGTGVSIFIMNLASWRSLDPAERALIFRHMPAASAGLMVDGYDSYLARAKDTIAKRGIVVTKGGADFDAMMAGFKKTAMDIALERAKKRGVADPQKVVDLELANLAKWRQILAKAGPGRAAYEKALWDNIYAKIDPNKL